MLQAYIEFKKRFHIPDLTFDDLITKGFKLVPDDDKNRDFFRKTRLNSFEVKNNLTEWYYFHKSPELECPNFRFILSDCSELLPRVQEFTTHILESETRIAYNVETHVQQITLKKLKEYSYFQEIMDFLTEAIT